MHMNARRLAYCGILFTAFAGLAAERTQNFDSDPGWDGHNNRATRPEPRQIRQDFGYSRTSHAGGASGEMGGFISSVAEPAYYAKEIPTQTFNDSLSASGKLACPGREFHVLIAFFNDSTINEWRTPNSIALRLYGRGNVFYAYVEYCTSRWRAGGDWPTGFAMVSDPASGRERLKGFPAGTNVHRWSLKYDPTGNDGKGSVTATVGNETAVCHLAGGHKADGATFNRFGLLNVMKQFDSGGEVWLDDVTINGQTESFETDPHWSEFQNRHAYVTPIVRPRFDFGFSPTHYASGKAKGEMGGMIYRGDGRYPHMMSFYGDRLAELTLDKPLRASGKICLRRGVSDSDVPFGFFHAEHSLNSGGSDRIGTPPDFIGFTVGGPSREGFYITPAYRVHDKETRTGGRGPSVYPDGKPHDWTFHYTPKAEGQSGGLIVVTLDKEEPITLELPPDHHKMGAHFNRFGLISTHTDGNAQHIYFDDLTYTWSQSQQ